MLKRKETNTKEKPGKKRKIKRTTVVKIRN